MAPARRIAVAVAGAGAAGPPRRGLAAGAGARFDSTVDPERDTPEMLRDCVSWAPGVTGSPDETAKARMAFRIHAQKVPLDGGGYTMDHSALVLLFDSRGRFFEPIGYQEDPARAMDRIRRMLGA